MKLNTKNQRPGPSRFSQEDFFFKFYPIWVYIKQVIPWAGPFLTRVFNLDPSDKLYTNVKGLGPILSDKKIFKVFFFLYESV